MRDTTIKIIDKNTSELSPRYYRAEIAVWILGAVLFLHKLLDCLFASKSATNPVNWNLSQMLFTVMPAGVQPDVTPFGQISGCATSVYESQTNQAENQDESNQRLPAQSWNRLHLFARTLQRSRSDFAVRRAIETIHTSRAISPAI